jgi:WD40 repeat protein
MRIWDPTSGRERNSLPAGDDIRNLAFNPDGRLAAYGPGGLRLWNPEDGVQLGEIRIPIGDLYGLSCSPDGKHVAIGYGTAATIWDLETATKLYTLGHSGIVWSIAYSPDGQRLASASLDQTVKIWNPIDGAELRTLRGHRDRVMSVGFAPDGKRLASGSADSTVRVWETESGEELATLRGHSGYVWSVAFSPDGKKIASAGGHHGKGEVKVWDLTRLDGEPTPTVPDTPGAP